VVSVGGGYDAARGGAAFDSAVEARLVGRLSVRAGGSYVGPNGVARPGAALKLDTLRQEAHGMNMALAAGYEGHGFNTVPALTFLVAASRTLGATTIAANAAYAQGLELDERYGDLRVAALHSVISDLHLGLDSRFRIDLERDSDEPTGEPDWELLAGPVASYSLGAFVLTAGPGVSAIKLRAGGPSRVGVVGRIGLGTTF
jgi:hypothetical protein